MPQIKASGADVAKLLWFYRPDGDEATAEAQRELVTDLVLQSEELSIPRRRFDRGSVGARRG
jgi:tagatose-1,6-bisphosphate aldolase